jgi:hypothetical protein
LVWRFLGSGLHTVRPGLAPFEQVVAIALRNTLQEYPATAARTSILVKVIQTVSARPEAKEWAWRHEPSGLRA